MPPRFHLDEHLSPAIAAGLRRRGVDVTTSAEAGLLTASDVRQIEYAADAARVIITCDADFTILHGRGVTHAGIVYWTAHNKDFGGIIRAVAALAEKRSAEDLAGRVEYLP